MERFLPGKFILLLLLLIIPSVIFAIGPAPQLLKRVNNGEIPAPQFLERQLKATYGEENVQTLDIDSEYKGFSGTFKALAILIDFPDKPAQTDSSTYDSLLFGNSLGNLKHYWSEVSYGNFTLTTINMPSSLRWFTAAETLMYYVGSDNGWGTYPNNAQKLAEEAILAADPYVDYSQYDNDNDGDVDLIFIIHAGSGAEFTGDSTDFLSDYGVLNSALTLDGVTIDHFTLEPEYWNSPGDMTIGVFARIMAEYLFNIPVLWDWRQKAGGLGDWSLMATGNWNGPSGLGAYPAMPDAWSRWQMGYLTPIVLTNDTSLTIPAVEDTGIVYRVWTNGIPGNQYFLLENRQQTGYDAYLPGKGLLIYHVDESVTSTPPNRYPYYPGNTTKGHYFIALEQADGEWKLERAHDNGNDGDPFPGSTNNHTFNSSSTPSSKDYAGNDTYVSITNINESGGNISADIQLTHAFSWTGTALVWEPDATPISGQYFKTFLEDSGYVVDTTPEILLIDPDSLQRYEYIFIALGMYPNNHVISDTEAAVLDSFLNLPGKKVYMEGGNTFRDDPQTSFHTKFNVGGTNKARDDLYKVEGVEGTFMDSLEFSYNGENNAVDRLAPQNGSIAIFENPDISYYISIAYDGESYKTIGSSYEFGGLVDNTPLHTKQDAFRLIMKFYNDKLPKPAPRDVVGGSYFNGMIPLTWDEPASSQQVNGSRTDTLVSYRIYRSTTPGGPYTLIADVDVSNRTYSDHEDYIDTTVHNDSTYYYVLTAFYNDTTESPYTHEISATPTADSVLTKQLNYSGFIPVLDGVLSANEWDDAVRFAVQSDTSLDSIFVYMKNSENHLYIALDDPNNTHDADDNEIDIWFDDDFSKTWDPTATTTEGAFIITYENTDSIKIRFKPTYGAYPDSINFEPNVLWPTGVSANASIASGHMVWEIDIDLQNSMLTASMGDTIGLFITEYDGYTYLNHYYNHNADWPYGAIYVAPQTFGPVILGVKPPMPEIEVNPASISEFVVGESSVVDTLWIKNVGTLKLGFSISDSSSGWLSESPLSDSVAAGDSLPVLVTLDGTGMASGVYNGWIKIASNDPYDTLVTVPVEMRKVHASIRSASLDKSTYKAGETISVFEEIDTYLASQVVLVTTSLLDSLDAVVVQATRYVTLLDSTDDGFTELLDIPDTTATGHYDVKIVVTDSTSGILEDTTRLSLFIRLFETWQVPMTVANDSLSMVRYFGGDKNATDGYDSGMDVATTVSGTEFDSYFYITAVPNYLSTDIKNWASPFTASKDWELHIVNTGGGNFTLTWVPDSLPAVGYFSIEWNGQSYDMRTTDSLALSGDGVATIHYTYQNEVSFNYNFPDAGWYMVSLPVTPADSSVSTLFPDALIAYKWDNASQSYKAVSNLSTGVGYWLAFYNSSSSTISGTALNSYSGHYTQGWHMIGALYDSVDFSNPNDNPDGSILITYGYNHSTEQYYATTTLVPGEGYWIAAYQDCDLTVSSGALTSAPVAQGLENQPQWQEFVAKFGSTPPPPPGAMGLNLPGFPVKKFTLYANYPNPFNPTTHIRFAIDKPGKVKLEIFNILGQRVITLLNENRKPGVYEVIWDAKDAQGHKVPSGIYFYRLKAGDKVAIKKMMLLK